jgi:hypothetical protein
LKEKSQENETLHKELKGKDQSLNTKLRNLTRVVSILINRIIGRLISNMKQKIKTCQMNIKESLDSLKNYKLKIINH